jgi:FixJ family two-component response regulator
VAEACREIGVLDIRLLGVRGLDFQIQLIEIVSHSHHLHDRGHGDIPMSSAGHEGPRRGFLAKPFRDQDMLVRNAVSPLEFPAHERYGLSGP